MMKNKLKRTLALTLAATAASSAFALTACGGAPDTEQTLEVHIWKAGYGTEFLSDLLDAFKNQDWVKSKYPKLQIPEPTADENKSTYTTKLDSPSSNTVDLFLTASLSNYTGKDASGYEYMADLTETVFNTPVPGEGTLTVKNKMLPTYLDSIWHYEKGQDSNSPNVPFKSYVYPWASGMDGFLYNADYLEALEQEVPLTTRQFLDLCEQIAVDEPLPYNKEAEKDGGGDYSIMTDSSGNYLAYLYPIWWGQYEGMKEYYNFFNGVHNGRISAEVFRQKGKLYTLTFMEELLKWNEDPVNHKENGYLFQKRNAYNYQAAQSKFLQGYGLFYANGDWFAKEMAETRAEIKTEYQKDYNIRMMRTPIISEIIFQTPSIMSDEAYDEYAYNDKTGEWEGDWYIDDESEQRLRAVIRAIDAGYATVQEANQANFSDYLGSVEQEDYEIIMEARGIVHAIGPLHQAAVPSYAKGKEIAFDFLRFMATDVAQDIYMRATGGASLPFNYDLEEKNPTLYNELFGNGNKTYLIEKDRLDMLYNDVYEVQVLPEPSSFPLVKWGEMDSVRALNKHSIVSYFAAETGAGTAKSIYESDISYYIGDKNKGEAGYFQTCLERAGLA